MSFLSIIIVNIWSLSTIISLGSAFYIIIIYSYAYEPYPLNFTLLNINILGELVKYFLQL